MSNFALNDYGLNWVSQLVTVDEMNIQLNQLISNVAYLTDSLTPSIIYGGEVLLLSSTSISVTQGVFRLNDQATTWAAPYTSYVTFYKCQNVTIPGLSVDGTYFLVARLNINLTDPNLIINTGSFVVENATTPTDIVLAQIIVAGGVISQINYDGQRANTISYLLQPNAVTPITTSMTISTGNNFILSSGIFPPITVTLPDLSIVPGGLYNRLPINITNNAGYPISIAPNSAMAGSNILGTYNPYPLASFNKINISYDQYQNSWYFN